MVSEYGNMLFNVACIFIVLILVLVEDGLGEVREKVIPYGAYCVLILVLVEDGLGVEVHI